MPEKHGSPDRVEGEEDAQRSVFGAAQLFHVVVAAGLDRVHDGAAQGGTVDFEHLDAGVYGATLGEVKGPVPLGELVGADHLPHTPPRV